MKIKLLMAAITVAAIGLSSCGSEDAKLAGELAGTWQGTTTQMTKGKTEKPDKDDSHKDAKAGRPDRMEGEDMSCTPTFTFVKTDNTNGGTIDISADYTVTKGVESIAAVSPVKATINGNVKAAGTWVVKDGDEVILTLDPSKTVVSVDTASLVLNYAQLTDAPQDSLAALKTRVAPNIANVVKPMLTERIQKMRKLDDVKISANTMTLEIGHNKMTFTKK